MTKDCIKCGETLPLSEFHKNRRSLDGFQHYCKTCNKQYQKVQGSNRPERYNKTNPDINARHHGIQSIPSVDPQLLWPFQNNRCALCGRAQTTRRLHRDHNHESGWVRGLLCADCNKNLPTKYCDGSLEEARAYLESRNCFSTDWIEKALYYLENPPYFQLLELKGIERPTGTYEEWLNSSKGITKREYINQEAPVAAPEFAQA